MPRCAAYRALVRSVISTWFLLALPVGILSGSNGRIFEGTPAPRLWTFSAEAGPRFDPLDDASAGFSLRSVLDADKVRLDRRTCLPKGRTAYRYQQMLRGLPVIGGSVVIVTDRLDRIETLSLSWAKFSRDVKTGSMMSRDESVAVALKAASVVSLRDSPTAVRAVFPRGGEPLTGWLVRIPALDPLGDWEVFIAADGSPVFMEDRLRFFRGSGLVFDPDPVTALRDTSLRDDNDAADAIPEAAYSEVELLDLRPPEDGQFLLTGQWVDTAPSENRAIEDEPAFYYNRADPRFEEVMCYYHIDHTARYVQDLGFPDIPPSPQLVNVNGIDFDMSFFSPFTGIITTGTGGVDDAEDADVIIHEYGHALMNQIIGDWRGGETALLSEGWCDYLAGDYSYHLQPDFGADILFNWDGHNEFWHGRVLNANYKHSDVINLNPHLAGQLWSSLLTEVARAGGDRDDWNLVVFDHLARLGDSVSAADAVLGLLQSDRALTDGRFHRFIVPAAERREILPRGQFSPSFTHRPLKDTEDIDASRGIEAAIASEIPLDPDRIWVIYAFGVGAPDTLPMRLVEGADDLYESRIPAPGVETDVGYYLVAVDTFGVMTAFPMGAPLLGCRYHVGPDHIPPLVTAVDSVANTVFRRGEVNLSTRIIDNLGVAAARVYWYDSRMILRGWEPLELAPDREDCWTGKLRWDMGHGEDIFYRIQAADAAQAGNLGYSGYRFFSLNTEVGVDDFEAAPTRWILEGWRRAEVAGRRNTGGLMDRPVEGITPPRQAIAELDERWDLSQFGRFRLFFWESHNLDAAGGETGAVEISVDNGENWEILTLVTGAQDWWVRHEIALDDYANQRQSACLRWRVDTPAEARPGRGWVIDEIRLSVNNIVGADEPGETARSDAAEIVGFPNPCNGRLLIHYNLAQPGDVVLMDAQGRAVMSLPLPAGTGARDLDAQRLTSGRYYLSLSGASADRVQPITIIK